MIFFWQRDCMIIFVESLRDFVCGEFAWFIMHTAQWTMHTVHCTLYTVHCTLYTVHCTLYSVHCTLYTVHCTLGWFFPSALFEISFELYFFSTSRPYKIILSKKKFKKSLPSFGSEHNFLKFLWKKERTRP